MELSSSKDYISKAIKQVKILKKLTIVYWRERLVSGKSYLDMTSTVEVHFVIAQATPPVKQDTHETT